MAGSTLNKIIILFHLLMSLWSIPSTDLRLHLFPTLGLISVVFLACIMKRGVYNLSSSSEQG